MNMEYTAQQWQWFLQQSQFQKQRPQTTHWRQPITGAATGRDNWWAGETAQAWAAASEAALHSNPLFTGRRQIQQQTNYRNVPWLRKHVEDNQPTPAAAEYSSPEGGQPRSGDPGLGHPPSEASQQWGYAPKSTAKPTDTEAAKLPITARKGAEGALARLAKQQRG